MKFTRIYLTQKAIFKHAEYAELYEARSDAKHTSGRFCDFCGFCVKNIVSVKFTRIYLTQKAIFKHAEYAELYEARSDAKHTSGRFCDFCGFCVKNIISVKFTMTQSPCKGARKSLESRPRRSLDAGYLSPNRNPSRGEFSRNILQSGV